MHMAGLRVDDDDRAPKFGGMKRDVSPFPADLSQREGILTTLSRKEWSGSGCMVATPGPRGTQGLRKDVGQTLVRKVTDCRLSWSPFQER